MITDTDIKKMKAVFATKEDLKLLSNKFEAKFSTKKELKALDSKMDAGFQELLNFIVEVKNEIMKELNDFRGEFNQFRSEMRDINRGNQLILNNHEARIAHLEYNKS